jgi:SAM-dependent methyltransferase
VGHYARAAEVYDLLYSATKDYPAESAVVASLIRDVAPHARTVLDVACGTGKHAECLTTLGFTVDGIDLEPAFVAIASKRCPNGAFYVGDMTLMALAQRYDAITCLFSAIGYARTPALLRQTLAGMASHLATNGVIIIDPWFEPGQLTDRWISMVSGADDTITVCRISRTLIEGAVSRLEFEYLIGKATGIERRSEVHELGLFTRAEMETAFHDAGLTVEWRDAALRRRGVYVGRCPG